MKTRLINLSLLALTCCFFLLLSSCAKEDPLSDQKFNSEFNQDLNTAKGKKASASGQAGLTIDGTAQHFAFHATKDADGNVSGSWETKSPSQNVRTHGTIDCMGFPNTNTAYLTGTVTQTNADNPFGVVVGDQIWFKVQDNGEGANADSDVFSDYYLFDVCEDFLVDLLEITNGNIQVKSNGLEDEDVGEDVGGR